MSRKSELPSEFCDDLDWEAINLPESQPITGHVAGPMIGIRSHHVAKKTRPCANWLSDEKLPCDYCGAVPLRRTVYLPFYAMNSQEGFVISFGKRAFKWVKNAKFGDLISAQLGRKKKSPAVVRIIPVTDPADAMPDHLRKRGPQDIWEYLTHLWGLAEKPKKLIKAAKKPHSELPQVDQVEDPASLAEVMRQWRKRLGAADPAPSQNGHHTDAA